MKRKSQYTHENNKRRRLNNDKEDTHDSVYIDTDIMHSASSVHNYILNDPILDIFKYSNHNDNNKEYTKEYSLLSEFFNLGQLFEKRIINLLKMKYNIKGLEPVCITKTDNESKEFHDTTINLLKEGTEVIYQGALKSDKFYGSPDLIIKVSCLRKFIKNLNISKKYDNYYTIVDIKYASIDLKSDKKSILNTGRMKANQCQVTIYHNILKNVINNINSTSKSIKKIKVLDNAFILGRSCNDSKDAFDTLGSVDIDMYNEYLKPAHNWLVTAKQLCKNSDDSSINICIKNNIRPNMCNKYDAPWHYLKKNIAELTNEITNVYGISYKARCILNEKGIYKWSDPNFIKVLKQEIPIEYHFSGLLKNMIETNIDNIDDYPIYDGVNTNSDIILNKEQLIKFKNSFDNSSSEYFFLDIETTSGLWSNKLESDYMFNTKLDSNKNTFLIGLMNIKEEYSPFLMKSGDSGDRNIGDRNSGDRNSEDIFKDMYKYVMSHSNGKNFKIFHWGNIEKQYIEQMLPELDTNHLCDLYKEVLNLEIGIRNCFGYGLKHVYNSLLLGNYVNGSGNGNNMTGLYASIIADKYFQNTNTDFKNIMNIIEYNKSDCLMLLEIFKFIINLQK